ncbi:MAG: XRE family transcriptional regulator [Sphingobacteriales bacterium]|nr:MAG: XRE family transcriptional regulator [Sphingobacteriales bacterium]
MFVVLTLPLSARRDGRVDERAIYRAFGRAVAERRNALGRTQDRVSKEVGLSRASLANIERGNQRVFLHQILALADALELSSSHEIVPARAIAQAPSLRPDIKLSGAKVTKDQKEKLSSIVSAFSASTKRESP